MYLDVTYLFIVMYIRLYEGFRVLDGLEALGGARPRARLIFMRSKMTGLAGESHKCRSEWTMTPPSIQFRISGSVCIFWIRGF